MRAMILLPLLLACSISAQEADRDLSHLRMINSRDRVDEAVRRGLKYLIGEQNKRTGAFNQDKMPNAMTGLTVLALLANGKTPDDPRYGKQLCAAIRYLVKTCKKGKGYFGHEAVGRMYSQGICTIALCEAFGMMPTQQENRDVGKAMTMALKVIVDAQVRIKGKHQGGWHYHPKATQGDLSVSAWQILAIKAALNCNAEVPKEVIESATAFVRRSYHGTHESFTYDGARVTHSMRAAGVVCLMALGAGKQGGDAVKVKNSAGPLLNLNLTQGDHYYCQSFFVAMCANALGGKYETSILPKLQNALLELQEKDGSFKKHTGQAGGVYSTAFAVLALSVRRQLLPASQN